MHKKNLVLFPIATLALAACAHTPAARQSSSSSGGSAPATSAAVLKVRSTSLGKVLVDGRGRTVYMLTADSPGHSTCDASCLAYWPAVKASGSMAHSAPGVSATIGSTALPSGGRTATAGGWPLYTFVKDTEPGDVYGQGITNFGGTWYVVSPSGHPIKKAPSASGSSSGSSSGSRGY